MDTLFIIKIIVFKYENHAHGMNHMNEFRCPNFTHCLPITCLPWFMYVSKKVFWFALKLIHSFQKAADLCFMYTTCFKHCYPQPFLINSRFLSYERCIVICCLSAFLFVMYLIIFRVYTSIRATDRLYLDIRNNLTKIKTPPKLRVFGFV